MSVLSSIGTGRPT